MNRFILPALLCLFGTGCMREYHPPEFKRIETSETAFLIPLTGDTTKQASFQSESLLKMNLVAVKEVEIPYRWRQTGRLPNSGEWIPNAVLLKVDRAPVSREWTADANSGTSARNEAVWVMSADSVKWSTGWTITARIQSEDDAVKFLFNYPSGSLKDVLDGEVRNRLQAVFGELVTDVDMDKIRASTTPFIIKAREDLTTFFAERGITITTLGITGGFVYEDKKIQQTLSDVFAAVQEKNRGIASTGAQIEKNKAIKLEAEGMAEAAKQKAKGEAEATLERAKAEASAIKLVADAKTYEMEQAKKDPESYFRLKELEIRAQQLKSWDGKYPSTLFQGQGQGTILQVPSFETKK